MVQGELVGQNGKTYIDSFQSRFRARHSEHCDLPLSNATSASPSRAPYCCRGGGYRLADAVLDDAPRRRTRSL